MARIFDMGIITLPMRNAVHTYVTGIIFFPMKSYLLSKSETNLLHSRLLSKYLPMKNYSLGEFEELVLLMVAALHDEAYGVAILENLEEKLNKKVNISAVHVALKRIEDKGFVKSRFGGITEDRGGRRKKFYVITALGKKVLDAQYELRTSIYKEIPKISFG
jgi:PadR family transcriptional regulator, regulatory protein PadR